MKHKKRTVQATEKTPFNEWVKYIQSQIKAT